MTTANEAYIDTTTKIMGEGEIINTRNSVVRRLTNLMITFDETPLVTVRKTAWKNALREMEWFLRGGNNINDLHESVRPWWEPWADSHGDIPANYGVQFRDFGWHGWDQISHLVDGLKQHPYSRRNVITTWETGDMAQPDTPITNCHGTVIQAFVDTNNRLNITMYQRSGDFLLGVQHNWIQYHALILWLARETGRLPGKLTWIGGDVHIYEDHWEVASEIINTWAIPKAEPQLVLREATSGDFKAEEFELTIPAPEPTTTTPISMIV